MPLKAFDNDFEGDYPVDGNYEFTHNKYFVGGGYRGVELSFFQRQDYYFRTVGDTFNLIYLDQNDIDFPLDEYFDIYLHVQQVDTSGLTFGYRFSPLPELELYVAGNYFESDDVLYGEIAGRLWQTESRPYADLVVDYIYTEDVLLDRPLTAPASGYGYSFDLGMVWQFHHDWRFETKFEDVSGRINWKHAPHTEAVMVSDRDRIDEYGRPYRVPTLSGQHGFKDRTQTLPVHSQFKLSYQFQKVIFSAEQETYDKVRFNRALMGYSPISWFRVEGGYDFKSYTKSLEFWTPYVSLLVGTNKFDIKESKNVRMELRMQIVL
ncbi:MAG TPA: hypothetical protein VIC26_15195, partial [Marinagarivorans sp.]